uniref:Target of myb1 like 2 membrane trafficking protein n=1 Tax=Denticeps clupeoides TaxID=299321 RepID=A0AAY4C3I2_9TELE
MEICDIINETEEGPKDAIRAVKKKLNGNRNFREVMLALTVLETCIKNCGHRFHVLVANRDFIDGVLVKILSPKTNPPTIVQDKVLALIQAWADAFRSSPDLTGVVQIYEELKRKGVEFPMADLDALSPIHTPQRGVPEVDPAVLKYKAPSQQSNSAYQSLPKPACTTSNPNIAKSAQIQGSINANHEQIARLHSELDIVRGNAKVISEMLTEMVPGQEDVSDLELLQELNKTCRAMQKRIVELISCISNEEVTEELLHVNDDLNNIFLRYERYERYRLGRNAQNNGVLSEATEDNLIDLGPGSPAVVSPRFCSTTALTSASANLSTQLAGLGENIYTFTHIYTHLHTPRMHFHYSVIHLEYFHITSRNQNVSYWDLTNTNLTNTKFLPSFEWKEFLYAVSCERFCDAFWKQEMSPWSNMPPGLRNPFSKTYLLFGKHTYSECLQQNSNEPF